MISYSIESNLFDKVIVSTDDEEIAKIATQYGAYVPFLRSKELSDDFIGTGVENEYVCTIFTRKIPYCRI